MAQSGHFATEFRCLLLGVKRTSGRRTSMSVFDDIGKRLPIVVTHHEAGGLFLDRPRWREAAHRNCQSGDVRFSSLIGRLRSSAFRLSTTAASASLAGSCFSSESAQGPSSMGSEDKVEQSLGRPCPMTGPSGHANSPHPSSREGRHSTAWWSSKYPPIAFDPERTSYRCSSSGPSELAAISPDAVHNDGQASR